jgi:hypothetical protein
MAIGGFAVFPVTMLSGGSASSMKDLGRAYMKVMYDCTGAGDASMFKTADTATGTARLVRYPVLSGMSAPQTCTVGSACSGSIVEVTPLAGLRFVQIVVTAGVTDGATLKLYCSDV